MNQDAIWDYFQNEGVANFDGSEARLSYLVKKIAPGSRVLNIGVGSGVFERLGIARGIDIHCIDPSKRAIESLKEKLGIGERARVGYSQEIPFGDHYFDVVVMSEVLEHLTDDVLERTIVEVHRVLADASGGGYLSERCRQGKNSLTRQQCAHVVDISFIDGDTIRLSIFRDFVTC